jgi:hypothetical protein
MAFTANKQLEQPVRSSYVDQWDIPLNGDMGIIDKALGSTQWIVLNSATSSPNYINFTTNPAVLLAANIVSQRLLITGTLAEDTWLSLPQTVGGAWIVSNGTSGAFDVYIGVGVTGTSPTFTPIGTYVIVEQSANSYVYSDGTNVAFSDNRTTGSGATGGGSDQIFFLNGLDVTTDYQIAATKNAMTAGPITIDATATVTIQSTSTWTIV